MSWHTPSLKALHVLDAVSRHGSFTHAATELHITQSAVSRQMRLLEIYLGVQLYHRGQRQIVLTGAGASYLENIRPSLEHIQKASLELATGEAKPDVLTIATQPSFGMNWLIPRLLDFKREHPKIALDLLTRNEIFDFAASGIDMAFHYGHTDWPNVASIPLTGDKLVLVAAPTYLHQIKRIDRPEDVVRAVKIQSLRRPNLWRDWLKHFPNTPQSANLWSGPRFEHYYLIIKAAVAGFGLALLPRIIVIDELKLGRLVNPLGMEFDSDDRYWLVYPREQESDVKIAAFRRWVERLAHQPVINET